LLSHRIASQLGTAFQAEAGSCDGLLLDVAELWELFLLQASRDAFPDDLVEHGTPDRENDERTYLLSNPGLTRGIGQLKPDIVVRRPDGSVRAVLDAKYKPLAFRRPDRIDGVDRADLYQLASYLSRYDSGGHSVGALLYPAALVPEGQKPARAQEGSPWSIDGLWTIHFATVPVTRDAAAKHIRWLLDPA
jgi:5-methylcytosine-specific restriction enzyme subunit McrC